ncbi:MAG: phosphoenolpyruvate carboxylase [Eggerthella lenta]
MAAKYFAHMVAKLAQECRNIGRNLTLESRYTAPSEELMNLWSHLVEMSETLTGRVADDLGFEPHRAVMLVMAARLEGTVARNADIMYLSPEELLADLRTVQDSLARAGAARAAYGVQTLIWQVETFGFHMVEMEFRQHSLVHERALADIRSHGVLGKSTP